MRLWTRLKLQTTVDGGPLQTLGCSCTTVASHSHSPRRTLASLGFDCTHSSLVPPPSKASVARLETNVQAKGYEMRRVAPTLIDGAAKHGIYGMALHTHTYMALLHTIGQQHRFLSTFDPPALVPRITMPCLTSVGLCLM